MEQKSSDAVDQNLNSQPKRVVNDLDFLELLSGRLKNSLDEFRRTLPVPESDAKSLQKDSLTHNEALLGDTEMPSTSKGLTSHLEPEPETTKKIKSDDCRSEDAEDDYFRVASGPGEKLGEDELTLIFSNTWLSAQDLLNLRLVSKRWRDAATTTLRRRDACVVKLWADSNFHPPCVRKSTGKLRDEDKLSQLTELISMSPKFPATDFSIDIFRTDFTTYTHFPDLLNFFWLHGDKIKTLRHRGEITARCLLDILHIYAPTLEGLDLSEADEDESSEGNTLKWTSKAVSVKSLTLGSLGYYCNEDEDNDSGSDTHESCPCKNFDENELIHRLLLSPSNLSCIENVTLDTLQMVLTEGKGHLIRSFKFLLWDARWVPASQLTKFVSLNPKPKLSKVTLDLENRWPSADATIINSLNEFIESFKDTVQTLELSSHYYQRAWDPLLNIPPMKNLKSFTLKLTTSCGFIGGDHLAPDCCLCQGKGKESKIFIGIRGTLFQFQDGISAHNYFPNLMDVSLHSILSKFNEVSPMSFFSFKANTDNADGSAATAQSGFFPKVDVLEINRIDVGSRPRPTGTCHCHYPKETSLSPEVFPNIRILKLKCGEVSNLSSDLWTLCPNVEFMEIYGITSCSSRGRDVEMSHFVDKIFTGLSIGMLRSLRRSGHPPKADDLEDFKFDPRISDLRHLRELKLKFVGKWSTKFASSVTGVHAFSKIKNTKFIISYDPKECAAGFNTGKAIARQNKIEENINAPNGSVEYGDDEIAKYEEFIFGPLKPYVHIAHERRKHYAWKWD